MSGIIGNFNEFFKSFMTELDDRYEENKRIIVTGAYQALANLQNMSPIDMGRYRASHTLTVDHKDNTVPQDVSGDVKRNRQKLKKEGGEVSPIPEYSKLAEEKLSRAKDKLDKIKTGKKQKFSIFITTNLDYSIFIENGTYSKDPNAPRKVYAKAREKLERIFDRKIK